MLPRLPGAGKDGGQVRGAEATRPPATKKPGRRLRIAGDAGGRGIGGGPPLTGGDGGSAAGSSGGARASGAGDGGVRSEESWEGGLSAGPSLHTGSSARRLGGHKLWRSSAVVPRRHYTGLQKQQQAGTTVSYTLPGEPVRFHLPDPASMASTTAEMAGGLDVWPAGSTDKRPWMKRPARRDESWVAVAADAGVGGGERRAGSGGGGGGGGVGGDGGRGGSGDGPSRWDDKTAKPRFLLDLEEYVVEELALLGVEKSAPCAARLQVFREVFQAFMEEFRTYKPLLSQIKNEYEQLVEKYSLRLQAIPPLKSRLNTVRGEAEQKIRALREEQRVVREALQTRMQESDARASKAEALAEELQAALKKARGELSRLRTVRDDLKATTSTLMSAIKRHEVVAMERDQKEETHLHDVSELRDQLSSLNNDYEKLMYEMQDVKLSNKNLSVSLASYQNKLQGMNEQLADERRKYVALQWEHSGVLKTVAQLTAAREAMEAERHRMRSFTPRPDWRTELEAMGITLAPGEGEEGPVDASMRTSKQLVSSLMTLISQLRTVAIQPKASSRRSPRSGRRSPRGSSSSSSRAAGGRRSPRGSGGRSSRRTPSPRPRTSRRRPTSSPITAVTEGVAVADGGVAALAAAAAAGGGIPLVLAPPTHFIQPGGSAPLLVPTPRRPATSDGTVASALAVSPKAAAAGGASPAGSPRPRSSPRGSGGDAAAAMDGRPPSSPVVSSPASRRPRPPSIRTGDSPAESTGGRRARSSGRRRRRRRRRRPTSSTSSAPHRSLSRASITSTGSTAGDMRSPTPRSRRSPRLSSPSIDGGGGGGGGAGFAALATAAAGGRAEGGKEDIPGDDMPAPLLADLDAHRHQNFTLERGIFIRAQGLGDDVPRYLRFNGLIRNRLLSKKDTERIIKQCWLRREAEGVDARQPLGTFFYEFLREAFATHGEIVDWAYNIVDALRRYKYDADVRLFLLVLEGQLPPEVHVDQAQMLARLKKSLRELDLKLHGTTAEGTLQASLTRNQLLSHLHSFFPIKRKDRMSELEQALFAETEGPEVAYMELFEENVDGDQGEFCETLREQYLDEVLEYVEELVRAIRAKQEALGDPADGLTCGDYREALLSVDPEKPSRSIMADLRRGFGVPVTEELDFASRQPVAQFIARLRTGLLKRSTAQSFGTAAAAAAAAAAASRRGGGGGGGVAGGAAGVAGGEAPAGTPRGPPPATAFHS
eukprot:PLAT12454.13.p1 GENE.PLAT12454.13~~PLAT12454.13.p1  ORF type:complete len:1222 (-),score=621.41 PLAT12454.13:105-3770(-)